MLEPHVDASPKERESEIVRVVGAPIAVTSIRRVVATFAAWLAVRRDRVVVLRDVHGAMRARTETDVRTAQEGADLVLPDGMPLVWTARLLGAGSIERVCGIDLLPEVCRHGVAHGWRHYFYGASPGVADELARVMRRRYPGIVIVGTHSPPFRPLTRAEDDAICAEICATRPDFVWVSLSTPKQDLWMHAHRGRCGGAIMIGVGGAFEINAGLIRRAPHWMQRSGLEWFYRLSQEPRRLWHRYFASLPLFAVLSALEIARARLGAPVRPRDTSK